MPIKDISTLAQIKRAIEQNPNDIFLIDDDKIIKKNALHDKIKFLKPKDGIEEEYLKEHGIGDMSVNDIDELGSHIVKRLQEHNEESQEDIEKYENINANSNEQYLDSICKANEKLKQTSRDSKYDNFDIDEVIDYLQEHPEVIEQSRLKNYINDDYMPRKKKTDSFIEEKEDDFELDESLFDFDEDVVEHENENKQTKEELHEDDFGLTIEPIEQNQDEKSNINEPKKQENDMSDSFSELDDLNEDEVLAALNNTQSTPSKSTQNSTTPKSNQVELNSNSVNDIASLITQLLNNKTLEITIKIKE
jgi:hypothetical protein